MRFRHSSAGWGILLLLAAVFVLVSQFIYFINIGIGSLIAGGLALALW